MSESATVWGASELASLVGTRAAIKSEIEALEARLAAVDRAIRALDPSTDRGAAHEHTGKYRALWAWLRRSDAESMRVTFSEIEGVLGFQLPPSSRKHPPHWHGYDGSAVARAIRDAGYRARNLNLDNETVEFVRNQDDPT